MSLLKSILKTVETYERPKETMLPEEKAAAARLAESETKERAYTTAFSKIVERNLRMMSMEFASSPTQQEKLIPVRLEPPQRSIVHQIAEELGLGSESYGDDPGLRHMVIYATPDLTPSEEHVELLRSLHPSEIDLAATLPTLHRVLKAKKEKAEADAAAAAQALKESAARAASEHTLAEENLDLAKLVPKPRDRRSFEQIQIDMHNAKLAAKAGDKRKGSGGEEEGGGGGEGGEGGEEGPSRKRSKPLSG